MKTSAQLLLFLAALSPAVVFGQTPERPNFVSLQVIQNGEVIFPNEAKDKGLKEGMVKLALQVDADGKLVDSIVEAYTSREFVEAAQRAIKNWKFIPATYHGENRGVITHVAFEFEERGLVLVRMDVAHTIDEMLNRIMGVRVKSNIANLSSLDKIPVPKELKQPYAPTGYKGHEKVTVEFFIDEDGKVRMPCIVGLADEELAYRAVEAVRNWTFEAPTSGGSPIMVRAQQTFDFLVK